MEILEVFTEEDIKFNRKMVDCALKLQQSKKIPDRRGGKMAMKSHLKSDMFKERDYDFTSEILGEFREKWGLSK